MRLIDADAWNDKYEKQMEDDDCQGEVQVYCQMMINEIDAEPTAYDVDKVVEQLELLLENAEHNNLNTYEEKAAYNTAYLKAIELVKAGGINKSEDGQK